jgi:hypothetical protein
MPSNHVPGPFSKFWGSRQPLVQIDLVFALDVETDESRVPDQSAAVVDERNLALGAFLRHRLTLGVVEAGHLEMDFGLGDEGADFRKPKLFAAACKHDHGCLPCSVDRNGQSMAWL